MKIIELCGVPGSGKSTAHKICREKHPELFEGIKGWGDLYPSSKLQRAAIKGWTCFRVLFGLLDGEEKKLCDAVRNNEKGWLRYVSTAIALFGRIRKKAKSSEAGDIYLLDEGLVQQLSSAAFFSDLSISGKESEEGVFLPADIEYKALYFTCDRDECVRRVIQRGRMDRYGKSTEHMKELIEIKDRNLRFLMGYLNTGVTDIDSGRPADAVAEELAEIIEDVRGSFFPVPSEQKTSKGIRVIF